VIDCWGTKKTASIASLAEVVLPGDFVIEHEGAIVRRIPPCDVENTLCLYETILAETLVPA
jgi:hydrogenase maturation factor